MILVAGIVFGGVSIYKKKTLQASFQEVEQSFNARVINSALYNCCKDNTKINHVLFKENDNKETTLTIYMEGKDKRISTDVVGYITFSVLQEYYNNLIIAEQSGDTLKYLDALEQIFRYMEYEDEACIEPIVLIDSDYVVRSDENYAKINDLFALDFEDKNIGNQIGFLPYIIKFKKMEIDEEAGTINYEYILNGVSYCETNDDDFIFMPEDENLICNLNNKSVKVKPYFRDVVFSSSRPLPPPGGVIPSENSILKYDINMYIADLKTKDDIKIKTIFFDEKNIMEKFLTMRQEMKDSKKNRFFGF